MGFGSVEGMDVLKGSAVINVGIFSPMAVLRGEILAGREAKRSKCRGKA